MRESYDFNRTEKGSLADKARTNADLRAKIERGRRKRAAEQRQMEYWFENDFTSGPLTRDAIGSYDGRQEES